MESFDDFERDLHQALAHLYDVEYDAPGSLWQAMGLDAGRGVGPLQLAIVQAIEECKPPTDIPAGSVLGRIYDVLRCRFVLKLTQEESAERLAMSVRSLRRAQREAVHRLAQVLWEQGTSKASADSTSHELQAPVAAEVDARSPAWLSQVREELAALRKSAPGAMADVAESVESALELARILTSDQALELVVGRVRHGHLAMIHPSALKQVLLAAIRVLSQGMDGGRIRLDSERHSVEVRVSVTARPSVSVSGSDLSLIQEIISAHGGSIELVQKTEASSLVVDLPATKTGESRVRVLVVDDNKDLVRSLQLYATGTSYDVVTFEEQQADVEAIRGMCPDAIVLDVMLPHIDGWELLVRLRAHPETRSVPVIVCSVLREEELALALGASLYLPKPVFRSQFLDALDEVLSPAAEGSLESGGNIGLAD
jgi:CheY-like chemotaxis protein